MTVLLRQHDRPRTYFGRSEDVCNCSHLGLLEICLKFREYRPATELCPLVLQSPEDVPVVGLVLGLHDCGSERHPLRLP